MDILHNPLAEMYGPEFLLVYGVLIAFALGVCWVIVAIADSTKNLPLPLIPTQPDAYEIGYLQGAEQQVAQLTVFNLIERGLLQVGKRDIERSPNYDKIEQLTPLQQEVFDWFTKQRTAGEIRFDLPEKIQPYCQNYEQTLQNQQLLYLPAWRIAPQQASLIAGTLIFSLGGYKFLAALANGHRNVSFLVILTVLAFIMLRVICYTPPRLSYLGQKYLQQLQQVFAQLRAKAKNGISPSASEYDLLIALFGVDGLIGTPYDSYRKMFISSSSSYSSSSSGGFSSSCGSGGGSSCGSGCGSSCGGGCGGGCGGCGS